MTLRSESGRGHVSMPVLITVGRQASVELTSRSDESNELIIVCARVRAVQGGAKTGVSS